MNAAWATYLRVLVLLAIAGFALVILSGFLRLLVVLCLFVVALWLWRKTGHHQ